MGVLAALMKRKPKMNKSSNVRHAFILLAILLVGIIIAVVVVKTAPKPQRASEAKVVRLVETIALKRSTEGPQWTGGGEVSAAQRVTLSPQVSGRIDYISAEAVPGSELESGKLLARIEQREYQLQVQQSQAAVVQAQATLDLERGQASSAKAEYELALSQINARAGTQNSNSASSVDNALVLRKPQVASAEAGLKTAEANLELMKLNLQRTQIKMPFKGQIISRNASIGSQVSSSNMVFDLVATNEFWVQVKVSQQFLPLLDISQSVFIKQGTNQREAMVLKTLVDVDAQDRQAKILISIKDPLISTEKVEDTLDYVLLGSYVEAILFAKPIENAFVIENRYIKEGGFIWVANDNKLYKRKLKMAYQGRFKSWVTSGVLEGDTLLISNIGVVTEGTPVRLATGTSSSNSKVK
jgi:RND family efflux transporter MFP subunit